MVGKCSSTELHPQPLHIFSYSCWFEIQADESEQWLPNSQIQVLTRLVGDTESLEFSLVLVVHEEKFSLDPAG